MLQLDQHTLIRKHHSSSVYLCKHHWKQTAASVSLRTAEDRWQESDKKQTAWCLVTHRWTAAQQNLICFRIKSSYRRNTADETDDMTGWYCKKREIIFCIKMKSVEAGGPRLLFNIHRLLKHHTPLNKDFRLQLRYLTTVSAAATDIS